MSGEAKTGMHAEAEILMCDADCIFTHVVLHVSTHAIRILTWHTQVQASWKLVQRDMEGAGTMLFLRLFHIAPELLQYFSFKGI
jgi:hypothetical protein